MPRFIEYDRCAGGIFVNGELVLIDENDYERLEIWSCYIWMSGVYHSVDGDGGGVVFMKKHERRSAAVPLDRAIANVPRHIRVYHLDGVNTNCRRNNLRTSKEDKNGFYSDKPQPNNKLGIRGVSWNCSKKKFCAILSHRRKRHFLGWFDNPEEAKAAYDAKVDEFSIVKPSS